MTVVSEGVEIQAHLEFLEEAACDYMQGYLIARPMSAAAAEEFNLKVQARAHRRFPDCCEPWHSA